MNTQLLLQFLSLCFVTSVVGAQSASNDTSTTTSDEARPNAGWVAGPKQRGTLILVYGCLSTIFASTWTVLHLNVPGPEDTSWVKALRKAKWMAITVLFPEFIFSKAVCELRLAVADLYAMHVAMSKAQLKWTDTVPYLHDPRVGLKMDWTWEAKFGRSMRVLHSLLGLGQLPRTSEDFVEEPQPAHTNESSSSQSVRQARDAAQDVEVTDTAEAEVAIPRGKDNDPADPTTLPQHEEKSTAFSACVNGKHLSSRRTSMSHSIQNGRSEAIEWSQKREWTLLHSYYANMGGLLYTTRALCNRQDIPPCTASSLASALEHRSGVELLKEFNLRKEDIEDKSKADWLLKAIAMSQISWLILNVWARHVAQFPITQLEIASVAFSLIAIATYAANWWKPKDITSSTALTTTVEPGLWYQKPPRIFISFIDRLLAPQRLNMYQIIRELDESRMIESGWRDSLR